MRKFGRMFLTLSLSLMQWQISLAADAPLSEEQTESSAVALSAELEQRRQQFSVQIDSLQSDYGPYDYRLLEPLQGLTAALIEAGEFEEAATILNQRLQVLRASEGPANLSQLSFIAETISNDIRLQNWQSVTDRFEFIQWVHGQNPEADAASLLDAMNDASAWHLAAVYFDSPRARVRHFLESREIRRDMLSIAEDTYGKQSEELISWLYAAAVEKYHVVAFLRSKDELGVASREGISRMEGRNPKSYLIQAYGIVKRIREILDTGDDLEAQAMAMIYVADFQMLRGLGTAASLYRSAGEKLQQAGIEQQQIDDFFARPVVLPVNQFHLSVEEALAQQSANGYFIEPAGENRDESIHMENFIAWNESLPYARRPAMPELARSAVEQLNTVEVLFSINSRGKSNDAEVQASNPDTVRVRVDARDAVEEMQFRPRFVNGRWRRVEDVTMQYLYPPAQ